MISLLKDLPDWMMGTALAGTTWFATAYGFLAPRAMDDALQADVYPACIEKLDAEQTVALDEALKEATREAEYARDAVLRSVGVRLSELAELERELTAYELMVETYRRSGLGKLFPLPDVDLPSRDQIGAQKAALEQELAALDVPLNISFPRVPKAELMKTCLCAGASAVAGKRTSYAISLASFRIISPAEVSGVKGAVMDALKTDVCGARPWELL